METFNLCLELLNFCLDTHISEISAKVSGYRLDDWTANILSCRGMENAAQIQRFIVSEQEGEEQRRQQRRRRRRRREAGKSSRGGGSKSKLYINVLLIF